LQQSINHLKKPASCGLSCVWGIATGRQRSVAFTNFCYPENPKVDSLAHPHAGFFCPSSSRGLIFTAFTPQQTQG
ncbi:hypothetical protein, partial [Pseudomonas sp.]|uniref:hypothetical protein n=1 Tax=Pseudomonas sp. TaxID=306 RepID=UPI003FD708C8